MADKVRVSLLTAVGGCLLASGGNAQTVEDCAAITDRDVRLECFDAAFGSEDEAQPEQLFSLDDAQNLQLLLSPQHSDYEYDDAAVDIDRCVVRIDSALTEDNLRIEFSRDVYIRDLDLARLNATVDRRGGWGVELHASSSSRQIVSMVEQFNAADGSQQAAAIIPRERTLLRTHSRTDAENAIDLINRFGQQCLAQSEAEFDDNTPTRLSVLREARQEIIGAGFESGVYSQFRKQVLGDIARAYIDFQAIDEAIETSRGLDEGQKIRVLHSIAQAQASVPRLT